MSALHVGLSKDRKRSWSVGTLVLQFYRSICLFPALARSFHSPRHCSWIALRTSTVECVIRLVLQSWPVCMCCERWSMYLCSLSSTPCKWYAMRYIAIFVCTQKRTILISLFHFHASKSTLTYRGFGCAYGQSGARKCRAQLVGENSCPARCIQRVPERCGRQIRVQAGADLLLL